ncbi:regulatory protein, gntR family [Lutibacter agarilyticus]|uniref:Regulatory protein, gntR family n=1 Tax=Lutibacter agarilyticus TaxID=1109740 RepID=A0A238Y665_9FLAO|nr:GntR family transcriptional regulator [Lutibacter agarilyticus]SNR65829.1 regulatory protein, gntR family [Lutibacter agarilyticus]
MKLIKGLQINQDLMTPLYLQIANKITDNIKIGNLKMGEKLPSINTFSNEYKISRDTVEKAYNILKQKGILEAKRGKGVYVKTNNVISTAKILFLLGKLSSYNLKIYDSFIRSIGNNYQTDFEIYHCNDSLFLSLMDKNKELYDYYVIMPEFENTGIKKNQLRKESINFIKSIAKEKLIMLDNNGLSVDGDIVEIYQDYETDIYNALKSSVNKIKKYERLNLIIPNKVAFPYIEQIKLGFLRFCEELSFEFKILNKIEEDIVDPSNLFIVITDNELFELLDLISIKNLTIGKDLGVISYNETLFKRQLDLDVFTTDFTKMGETAANMIINNKRGKIKNQFNFIPGNSM